MPITTHRQARNEFEILIVGMCALSAFSNFITRQVPPSLAAAVDSDFQFVWSLFLMLASVFILVGAFWRGAHETGLWLELSGMIVLAGATLVYGITIILAGSGGAPASTAGAIILAVSVACMVRSLRIFRVLFGRTSREELVLEQVKVQVAQKAEKAFRETQKTGEIPKDVEPLPISDDSIEPKDESS